jgi:hypothetical protein
MIYPDLELLDDTGFSFEQVAIQASRITAQLGDGFVRSTRIGAREGLKAWKIKADVLPDLPEYLIEQETRARYLWQFWVRHKLENDLEIFRMRDPFARNPERPYVFARFQEDNLDYQILTGCLYAFGLAIVEARIPDLDPNDYNEQQI